MAKYFCVPNTSSDYAKLLGTSFYTHCCSADKIYFTSSKLGLTSTNHGKMLLQNEKGKIFICAQCYYTCCRLAGGRHRIGGIGDE